MGRNPAELPEVEGTGFIPVHVLHRYQRITRTQVQISMDSAGSYMDNVFVERLWRSVKYEEGYLKVYESVAEARPGIGAT